jgi:hypothetical protein
VKCIFHYLPLVCLLGFTSQFANAQSQFDLNLGFGTATDKASSTGIDVNPTSGLLFGCTAAADPTCVPTKSLSGFMLGFGGDVLLWKHVGFGADVNIQPVKQNYAVFQTASADQVGYTQQSRVTFYDFNAIVEPISQKRVALKIFGGVGGANLKFYQNETGSDVLVGNVNSSSYYGSSNHFDVDFGAGLQIYVSGGFFVRPEVRIHYVNNFSQFGSNIVPEYMAWIGYNWGGNH